MHVGDTKIVFIINNFREENPSSHEAFLVIFNPSWKLLAVFSLGYFLWNFQQIHQRLLVSAFWTISGCCQVSLCQTRAVVHILGPISRFSLRGCSNRNRMFAILGLVKKPRQTAVAVLSKAYLTLCSCLRSFWLSNWLVDNEKQPK